LRAAELALDATVGAEPPRPSPLTVFGHHNLSALIGPARWRLGGLMHRLARDGRFRVLPLYVSAHRHKGGWLQSLLPIAPLALRRIRYMDLNVSSLVDWPLASRDVALSGAPDGWHDHHLVVVSSQRPLADDALFRDPTLFPGPKTGPWPEGDLARARAIGRADTLAQRRNPRRLMPLRRLRDVLRDPERDALAAEVALLVAAAGTLHRLLEEAAATHGGAVRGQNAARDALRLALNDAATESGPSARPSRATFERLRRDVHRGAAVVRELAGTATHPTPFRAVLRAAIIAAAREDLHRQWMAQPHLVPAIGDRWFRRAANIDERYGLLRTYDPCDPEGHRRHSTRLRGYRHRSRVAPLVLALAVAVTTFCAPDASARAIEIRVARFEGDAIASDHPVEVSLPHVWPSAPTTGAPVRTGVYRVALPPFPPGEPLWVYVPKLRTNAQFELNGHWVADGGRMQPPIARHANSPFFVALPPGLARDGGNELLIRVVAPSGSRGGLSAFQVGPRDTLAGTVALRRLAQNAGVYATSAVLAATSIYILLIWWHGDRPRSRAYPLLATAGLVWAARNLNLVLLDFGTASDAVHRVIEYSTFVGHGVFLALFGLFLLDRHAGLVPPRLALVMRWAIAGFLLLGLLLIVSLGGPAPALTLWLAASAPLLAAMAWILLRRARQTRASADRLLAALFVSLIAASVYDNAVLAMPSLFGRIYIAHYVGLAFFATIAVMLAQQYSSALQAYTSLNQSLESRLREREREIELRFHESRILERERVALEERARIMRDLHDGVGAQLLAAIHEIGDREQDATGIRAALVACLDDLRLAVDSLEPHENYLTTILGSLRYRMTPRLASAGIQVVWDVKEVGPLTWLDPSRTLHLLRILQEAISNVLKHAEATHIAVRLARTRDGIEVEVRDDGRGFDPTAASVGHGLRNLRHRATLLGARLTIESGSEGSLVRVVLPD
jgi:signal transduction histidine kinase